MRNERGIADGADHAVRPLERHGYRRYRAGSLDHLLRRSEVLEAAAARGRRSSARRP